MRIPAPDLSDRALAAAQLNAFASKAVQTQYGRWRKAADDAEHEVQQIRVHWHDNYGPDDELDASTVQNLKGKLRPAEVAARRDLAEAVASELRHRKG